jgi:hypothetical protein
MRATILDKSQFLCILCNRLHCQPVVSSAPPAPKRGIKRRNRNERSSAAQFSSTQQQPRRGHCRRRGGVDGGGGGGVDGELELAAAAAFACDRNRHHRE